jgi:hypothetical protein
VPDTALGVRPISDVTELTDPSREVIAHLPTLSTERAIAPVDLDGSIRRRGFGQARAEVSVTLTRLDTRDRTRPGPAMTAIGKKAAIPVYARRAEHMARPGSEQVADHVIDPAFILHCLLRHADGGGCPLPPLPRRPHSGLQHVASGHADRLGRKDDLINGLRTPP